MGLIEDAGAGPVALDTVGFIYFIEENPEHIRRLESLFQAVSSGRVGLVTSALTLLEVLVVPYRAGDQSLATRYEALLTRGRGLHLVPIDRAQLRAAAHLRAVHRVRTPDAIQLAAALTMRCTAFVTNDRDLPGLPGLRILQLRDYV